MNEKQCGPKMILPAGADRLRVWIFAVIGGIVFAAFDRFGYMLKSYGSIWAISENFWHRNIWMRILIRIPASVAAVLLLMLLVDMLGVACRRQKKSFRGSGRYWFPAMWLLYFVSFLPAFLGGFPGLFAADAPNQVGWTFSGWLTAHHPLLHTGILCGIFSAARGLGWSDNTAAAIYTLLQMLAMSGIFAWLSRFLKKEGMPCWLQAGTALFLLIMPFHGMMAIYTTKDTLFAGLLVLTLIQIYHMCRAPEEYFQDNRRIGYAILCFTLLFLFRNNGFHTMVLCMPFFFLYLRKYRKKVLLLFAGVLLCYGLYSGPFLNLAGVEPGNAREAYSVVMQTLGRTYVAGGDIRTEEMDVLRPVMDEETLALYTPDLSDSIKNYFHTDAFDDNRILFLKTWLQIGLRNKKIYADAFLNTTYAFWYPNAENEYLDFVCFDIEKDNPAYPHVQMRPLCGLCYRYYSSIGTDAAFRRVPVLREILSMGFYFWFLAFCSLYLLYRRYYVRLLWILPLWTYMATCLLGPAALLRYAYPLMLAAPLLLAYMVMPENGE